MKHWILVLLLIGLVGCGTSINVMKKTYNDEGKLLNETQAGYWSSKDVTAPSFSIDKNAEGYNLKMQADNSNNSEPLRQVKEGMQIMLNGMNKFK